MLKEWRSDAVELCLGAALLSCGLCCAWLYLLPLPALLWLCAAALGLLMTLRPLSDPQLRTRTLAFLVDACGPQWMKDLMLRTSLYEFLATPSPLLSQLMPAAALSSVLDEDEFRELCSTLSPEIRHIMFRPGLVHVLSLDIPLTVSPPVRPPPRAIGPAGSSGAPPIPARWSLSTHSVESNPEFLPVLSKCIKKRTIAAVKSAANAVYDQVCSNITPAVGITTAAIAAGVGIYAFCIPSGPSPSSSSASLSSSSGVMSWLTSRKVLSGTLTCVAVPALVMQLLRHKWVGFTSCVKGAQMIVGVLCVLAASVVVQQLRLRSMGGLTAAAVYRKLMGQISATS